MIPTPKKILIVDDSPLIVSRLEVLVRRSACAGAVFSARTFEAAVAILQEEIVDIALFDIHLEEKSGIELLKYVHTRFPGICVVMFTNQSGPQVEKTCKALGASYFLDKSTDFPKIPELIASLP